MIKPMLKRIFAITGSAFAPIAAIFYFILGIQRVISISDDVKSNFFLTISFLLLFAVAVCVTFFGAKVLFSFLNKEDDCEPFTALVLSFLVFQFAINLLTICFWGGNAANWLLLVFSFAGTLTLFVHVLGVKTAWYSDVIGVSIGMLTALTVACASGGLILVSAIIMSVICFMVISIYALTLIKDKPIKTEQDQDDEVVKF